MKRQLYIKIILSLFFFVLFLPLLSSNDLVSSEFPEISYSKIKRAQFSNESFYLPKNYELIESCELNNSILVSQEVSIPIPEGTWNLNQIEMNLTNIKMEREIKIIEDNTSDSDFGALYWQNVNILTKGLSVQLKILEQTIIYGISIYGNYFDTGPETITFQLRGYNQEFNNPNNTIYGMTNLNMSYIPQWYYQNFSSENITLQPGNYSLVMNGSDLLNRKGYYLWGSQFSNPSTFNLHTSMHDNIGWSEGAENTTFLHKIHQKVLNYSYFPEDINMTVDINEELYSVENGGLSGEGNLLIRDINVSNISGIFQITFTTNQSMLLNFNLSYRLKVSNIFECEGELILKEGFNNIWKIYPIFTKYGSNYTIRMDFSSNWFNLTVFKDNIIILNNIIITQNSLYILNEGISDGDWLITGNSINRDLDIYIPKTDFLGGERLQFSVNPPEMNGNVTFLLVDSLGFEANYEKIEITSSEIIFIYDFLQKPDEGEWMINVFWNTNNEAGIQSYLINVKVPFDPMIIVWSLTIIILGIIIGISSYVTTKKYLVIKKNKTEKKIHQYLDILKMNYLMISEKKSGLNIFERSYVGKKIDPTLISGYLNAFKIFGVELAGSYHRSQIAKLEYQKIKIIMADYRDLRLTLIFNGEPSNDFYELISSLSYELEEKFKEEVKNFMGDRRKFIGIESIIDKHINTSFILPLNIYEIKGYEYNKTQNEIINKIKDIKEKNKIDVIFSSFLMKNQIFDLKTAEIIKDLIKNGTLKPIIENKKIK
ncbi:MAG: hypothetical protein KGD63_00020 [Candidatus Lokiarchaeota archaeon]|nr:hypothetical protein [Candidatus Lokiarchaeota archaeon]